MEADTGGWVISEDGLVVTRARGLGICDEPVESGTRTAMVRVCVRGREAGADETGTQAGAGRCGERAGKGRG